MDKAKYYQIAFQTDAGKKVLEDLAQFCHSERPTYVVGDALGTAYNEGMRRVYLRINAFLNKKEPITEEPHE